MKVNGNKTNSKGKGLAKKQTASPRTQTITSMFMKQRCSENHEKNDHSPYKSVSSDDDVKIVKVESESQYFGQSSLVKHKKKETKKRGKLSLRGSSVANGKGESGDAKDSSTFAGEQSTNQSSSQEVDSLGSNKKNLSRKLSLRKRKSDALEESERDEKAKVIRSESNVSEKVLKDVGRTGTASDRKSLDINDTSNKTIPYSKVIDDSTETSELKVRQNHTEGHDMIGKVIDVDKNTEIFGKVAPATSKFIPNKDKLKSDKADFDDENSQQNNEGMENNEDIEFRTPYYLENFRTVLNSVFEDDNNVKLYSSDDLNVVSTFNQLSEPAQKLYLRLFCRKWSWIPFNKLKYPNIAEDLKPIVDELVQEKLFCADKDLTELQTVLKLLSGGDMKTLGKMYHINIVGQNKSNIIDLLIKKTKQNTIGSMFKMVGNSPETVMLNRAKKLLGTCISVSEEARKVFARTMMLFSLTDTVLDEDSSGQTLQLFQMLRVNIGQITYPTFTVNKKTQIFSDRQALLRFCEASLLEFDILTKLERNKYTEAFEVYEEAVRQYDKLSQDKCIFEFDRSLPVFLRPFTACGVYVRVLNQGVEILQRRKDYVAAVELLKKLLSQDCYCQHYRGHWWERLALNYDTHLKRQDLSLQAVEDGLSDKFVRTGRRLALYQRAEKICTTSKSKYKARMKDFHHEELVKLPEVTIEGNTLSDCIQGQKYKFMIQYSQNGSQTDTDDIAFCGVEEVVLDHYKHNGFTDGIHAEGSVISCLFGLFFWDILFMDIPDVFHSLYQSHPLDLYTEDFYINRQSHIDKRLELLKTSSPEDLTKMVAETWETHEGTICGGLNWERFNNLEHVQGLVECIGGTVLSGMLGRYAKDPRHTRSGFPDLTLWNTDTKHFKICEVKGPGDRLSHKQIMWLDFLLKMGVDAEVCHVKAVGSKRLKKSASNA